MFDGIKKALDGLPGRPDAPSEPGKPEDIWKRDAKPPRGVKFSAAGGFRYEAWAAYHKKIFSGIPEKDARLLYELIRYTDGVMPLHSSLTDDDCFGEMNQRGFFIPPKNDAEIEERKRLCLRGMLCQVSLDYLELYCNRFSLATYEKADPTRRYAIIFVSSLALDEQHILGASIKLTDELATRDKTADEAGYVAFAIHRMDKQHYVLLGDRHPKKIEDELIKEYGWED
jgi:hypothetical protein